MLGAQIYLVDEARSLSFDEKMNEPANTPSSRLEGVWWLPSRRGGEVKLALSNTTDAPLSVTTSISGAAPERKAETILELAPHETRLMDVERDLLGRRWNGLMSKYGGISIEHNGVKGALVARAMAQDASVGYSLAVQFVDPKAAKSLDLQGAGLRLGEAGGEQLTPVIVARNASVTEAIVSLKVPYTTGDASTHEATIPEVRFAPGETKVFDLSRAVRASGLRENVSAAGIELHYTGEMGSIVTSAFSVSESGNQVFRVPLWDIEAQRSATGGYPWYIEGDSSTVVYIKNVTDAEQMFTLQYDFDGGTYMTGARKVEPRQTIALDVRKLRDEQIPDERGRKIPPDAARGQIMWSVYGPEDLVLVGRSEQADVSKGVSSNYACQNCCGNSHYSLWLTPSSESIFTGDSFGPGATQQEKNCYNTPLTPFTPYPLSWSSSDSGILSVSGSIGTGMSEGGADMRAHFSIYNRFYGGYPPYCSTVTSAVAPGAPVDVRPAVTFTTATLGNKTVSFEGAGVPAAQFNGRDVGLTICGDPTREFTVTVNFALPDQATALSTSRSSATRFGSTSDAGLGVSTWSFENQDFASRPKNAQMVIEGYTRTTGPITAPYNAISIVVAGDYPRSSITGTFSSPARVRITCE